MDNNNTYLINENIFPFWNDIAESDRKYISDNSTAVSYSAGEQLHDGTTCSGVFIVKKGCLRVYIMSDEGKDITLYRLHPGDMCMLAASCVIQAITFDVFVTAEEDTDCVLVSGPVFNDVSERNPTV